MPILCSKKFNSGHKFFYTYQLNEVVDHIQTHTHTLHISMELDLISAIIKMKFMYYCFRWVGGHVRVGRYLLLTFFRSLLNSGNQFAQCTSLIGESLMHLFYKHTENTPLNLLWSMSAHGRDLDSAFIDAA